MPFAPEYLKCVLHQNFADAKTFFLAPLMSIHYAHLVMLRKCDIVSPADAHSIRAALDRIPRDEVLCAPFDPECEDLFYYVDRRIAGHCGESVAGRLHTARSRNDIDMTLYRMRQRESLLELIDGVAALRRVLLDLAGRHRETVFAVHTHTQRAQPTTVAHYLLAVEEQLARDSERLTAAYRHTNCCPLGACAITGTGFPIDRDLTSQLLGFRQPTVNTYGSIATVDYLLEGVSAAAVCLAGHGRFVQDLLLWSTAEFHYLRIGDGFVQSSSIMPQKRNPVAFEHARAICSKALGQAQAIVGAVHNTPFGDIVDTEDDLQPLVFAMYADTVRTIKLVAAALETAEFDAVGLAAGAADGWTTLTELADTLAREHNLPFGTTHAIARRLVSLRETHPERSMSDSLAEACAAVLPAPIEYSEERLAEILSARHFVEVRRTWGGPAPEETARAAAAAEIQLQADVEWSRSARVQLGDAAETLARLSAAL